MDTDTKQSINDDQELAKVLAGVTSEANNTAAPDTSQATVTAQDDTADSSADEPEAIVAPIDDTPPVVVPPPVDNADAVTPSVEPTTSNSTSAPSGDSELDSVKLAALQELRPLVDKLNVSPEEKFDTYLLLLRSTDDKALIAPAHDAAKNIVDETKRAQALLDIIKEIDFLSGQTPQV